MWNFLRNFEAGDFSSWLREGNFIMEPFATYYVMLGLHAIGMAMVVGISFMLASRILGFQLVVSLREARQLLGLAWAGFWLNLISGLLLIIAQPRRELITPLFWVKMALIVIAVLALRAVGRGLGSVKPVGDGVGGIIEIAPHAVRVSAIVVSLAWLLAIVTGRLVGYTQPPPPL